MTSQITVSDFDPEGLFASLILPSRFRRRCKETRFKQEWKLAPRQYLQMMREFAGPKYQKGNLRLLMGVLGTGGVGIVVLTDHTLTSTDLGNLVNCRVEFQSVGTLVHDDDGTDVNVQAGEWHSNEPSTTGANFEVRYLSVGDSGDAYTQPAAAADVWITIDANRSWGLRIIGSASPSQKTHTSTFELGDVGTSTADDSGVITLNAEN